MNEAPDLRPEDERLDEARLKTAFAGRALGRSLRVYETVGSTQNEARSWAVAGAPHGALVMAEEQRSGRGRMGRVWHSPSGKGLWMSLVIRTGLTLEQAPHLTLVTAVAVCRAIRQATGADARLKWPNDILIGGRKIAGILVELQATEARMQSLVVGIGISVNLDQADFPDELQEKATSLRLVTGNKVDRTGLAIHVVHSLEEMTGFYLKEGFPPVGSLWEALSDTLGNQVRVETPLGPVVGKAARLDDNGALVVRLDNGEERKLYSGDLMTNPDGLPGTQTSRA
ncbi:biotin--[acetyl-CoA-carboxylase] ligase [Gorillibacterium timonense]|uniref:biotin--[acetyl-CoA-carboxylase] ligase n=1 Tax=Gorillibacterium timonense TaxID=1689269 RepID=UPI00071C80B0|nr:biotin--[acetyl-CoA-carboxylase] ligase [Gorillibacterium timonense]